MSHTLIETERLLLRPISVDDAEFYLRVMNTPKWLQFIGDRNVHTVDAAREYISQRMLGQWEKCGYGNYIVLKKPSEGNLDALPVGCMGLFVRDGLEGCDLGFAFVPEGEKQGFALESGNRLLEEAFGPLKLKFVNAITDDNNVDSQRLLEKLGFQFVEMITLPNESKSIRKYILQAEQYNTK